MSAWIYYKLELSGPIFDTTNEDDLLYFIKIFEQKYGFDMLTDHIMIRQLIQETIAGKSSGVIFGEHVFMVISNDYELYNAVIGGFFNFDVDLCLQAINELFQYKLIKLNNKDSVWILGLDKDGAGISILEEIEIE